VKRALGEAVSAIANAADDPEKIAPVLTSAGHLLAKLERNDIARKKLQADIRRAQPEEDEDEDAPYPRQVYINVAVDVLQRLRTYDSVRKAIDPLRYVLEEEFGKASQAFVPESQEPRGCPLCNPRD
jgi:hypothetical protein